MRPAAAFALALLAAAPAAASSSDAWEEFRADVATACAALAAKGASVAVDPFGTSSYGVALVSEPGASGLRVCVFDKGAGTAELSDPVAPPVVRSERPAPRR